MEFINNINNESAFIQNDEEENDMIIPSVNPDEWYKEFNRVKQYIEKEFDSKGAIIDFKDASSKIFVDITYMDELLNKIDQISEHFSVITEFLEGDSK